jgi:polysaccharide transporter, PST family
MPVYQLVSPLSMVGISTLSRIADDRDRFARYVTKSLRMIAFCGVPVSAFVALAGKDIVITVLGNKWAPTGPVLQAFGPGIVMLLMSAQSQWIHTAIGRMDRLVRWTVFSFVAGTALLVCGLLFGVLGVAVAYVAAFYLLTWPALIYAAKPIGLRLGSCFAEIARCFVAGIGAGVITWFLVYSSVSPFGVIVESHLLCLALSFVVVMGSYIALTMLLLGGRRTHAELIELVREMVPSIGKRLRGNEKDLASSPQLPVEQID